MKNKIIYLVLLICCVSMISSAKKISGCAESRSCEVKQESIEKKTGKENTTEPVSLSLFFFNI